MKLTTRIIAIQNGAFERIFLKTTNNHTLASIARVLLFATHTDGLRVFDCTEKSATEYENIYPYSDSFVLELITDENSITAQRAPEA